MRNMLPIVTVKQIARRFGEVSEFVASGVEGGQRHRETVLAERKRVGAPSPSALSAVWEQRGKQLELHGGFENMKLCKYATMKPMLACLVMLPTALLHAAEGDVKIGDTNRLEVATSVAKLVFDTSNAPDLRQWTDERFAPTTREWVVKLAGIMASDGWTPPKEIHFQFVADQLQSCKNAAALASAEGNTVSLNADWFRKNLDGEALGATIHVLVRFMQGYCSEGQNKDNCPRWAVEGYADYIRWMLFEPEADGCGFVRKNPDKYRYNDSYRVTAHFFGFVENRYPGTMKKLNAALRNHTFDNGKFWQDATGKSVEELEADWKTALAPCGKFKDGMLSTTRPAGMRI